MARHGPSPALTESSAQPRHVFKCQSEDILTSSDSNTASILFLHFLALCITAYINTRAPIIRLGFNKVNMLRSPAPRSGNWLLEPPSSYWPSQLRTVNTNSGWPFPVLKFSVDEVILHRPLCLASLGHCDVCDIYPCCCMWLSFVHSVILCFYFLRRWNKKLEITGKRGILMSDV